MSGKFQTIDRDTAYLLPPSLQDWLPAKHLARFVVDIVEQLDRVEIESRYGGGGKQPYHPALLPALLFYGYATGVFSSGKLEQATYDSVAFRFITGDRHPDHDTVASFRKRFLNELEGLFVQLLVLAKVETVFGIVKEVMRFRRFHLRGFDAAQGEWNLVCMAWNLKRMFVLAD
jgi:transposase